MADTIHHSSYSVRFRVRTLKKKRKKKGRTRGFYQCEAVYLRVRWRDGYERDIYLGTTDAPAKPKKPGVEESKPAGVSSGSRDGGRSRGENTLDPDDDRTMTMFHMEHGRRRPWR